MKKIISPLFVAAIGLSSLALTPTAPPTEFGGLALNGEKDYLVLPENLAHIKELNYNAECMILPGHNHLFLECDNGLPQEYPVLKGDISDETLQMIVDWPKGIF